MKTCVSPESLGSSTKQLLLAVFLWRSPIAFDRNINSNTEVNSPFLWTLQGMVFLPNVINCQLKKWRDIESQLWSPQQQSSFMLSKVTICCCYYYIISTFERETSFTKSTFGWYRSHCTNRQFMWWLLIVANLTLERVFMWVIFFSHLFFNSFMLCEISFSSRVCMNFFFRVNISFSGSGVWIFFR